MIRAGRVEALGKTLNGAGRGHRGAVRGCLLGTAHDCCEWHASGTAGEGDRGSDLDGAMRAHA
jgi:hypothetical protein